MRECLDEILKLPDLTYDDFKQVGMLKGTWEYKTYERRGFHTPSGKFEIFSERMKEWDMIPSPITRNCPNPL